MADLEHLYWDSCVFYRYLTEHPEELVDDIHRFVEEAMRGQRKIYASTVVLAEIRQDALKKKKLATIDGFFQDVRKAVNLIDPNPIIMMAAGRLKDCQSTNPANDRKAKSRVIGTADAIHLATCIYLRDARAIQEIVFHTFDDGKQRNWEGRCVPILSFEDWYPEHGRQKCIQEVCDLQRIKPIHPVRTLFSEDAIGASSYTH